MAPRVPFSGYDLLLDETVGLTYFRDGQRPAASGGNFGQAVATQPGGDKDQYVVYDRLFAGMGGTERLIPHSYALGIDVTTRFGRIWTPGGEIIRLAAFPNGLGGRPAGEIRALAVWNDQLLIGAGGLLFRLPSPYTAADLFLEWQVDPTEDISSIVVYQGMICLGTQKASDRTPGRLHVRALNGTWTRSLTANRQYLCQAYFRVDSGQGVVGEWRLDGNDTPYTHKWIATTSDATLLADSSWANISTLGYPVADATNPITNIVGSVQVIYHLKTDGLYQMQPDGRAARLVDWSSSLHPNNGRQAVVAHGAVYASHGRQGMVKVDVANQQIQWSEQACAPGSGMPRITPITGDITALGLDGEWLVGNVWNGTDSFVAYGRPTDITQRLVMEEVRAPQALNWHGSEATFWGQRVTKVLQASIGPANRPLLWVASLDGSTPVLSNVSLPALGSPLEDWLLGGPHRFTTDCWLYLPREDLGANEGNGWANAKKIFTRIESNVEYLQRYTTYVDTYLSTSGGHDIFWDRALDPNDTAWTLVGRLEDAVRGSMVPPTSVQSGPQVSMMFRGHSERDHPFAFNSAKLRAMPLSEQAERRRFRVLVAGRVRKRNQSLDRRDQYSLLNQIMGYMEADPVSLLTHHNVRYTVKVEEGLTWQETPDAITQEPTIMVDFTCKVLKRPFYWGSNQRYGLAGIVWS